MRKPVLASLALASLLAMSWALPTPARPRVQPAPADPELWLTLAQSDLLALEEFLGRERLAGLLTVLEGNGVARLARARESRLGELAAVMHQRFRRCGGFTAHATRAEALAMLDAAEQPLAAPELDYTIDNGATVRALIAPMAADNVRATIQHLSSYSTRYYTSQTGVQAAQWLKDLWEGYALGRGDVRVFLWPHTWAQPSVVARIQGTQFPNEAIVIGGHLDSTSYGAAPGADDNASGLASLTETFRAAMATGYRPARSVFFMAYAAEEVGLRGSGEIAGRFSPLATRFRVVGKLQFDMTNYKGSVADFGILKDTYTSAAQDQFLTQLITAYAADIVPGAGATYDDTTQCGYACSDHASWGQRAFPASIAFESRFDEDNPYIHSPNDTLANSDPTAGHAVKFARLGAAYMAELAKGSIPPPGPVDSAR